MNIKATLSFASLLLLLLVSCQREETGMAPEDVSTVKAGLGEMIISAEMAEESTPDTRTVLILDESVSPAKQRLYWLPNDTIKVFSAGESAMFVSMNTEPSRKAKFRGQVSFIIGDDGESEKDYVWGLYPYREDARYYSPDGSSENALLITRLPDVQTGKPGSFDSGLATMIGRSESLTLSYKAAYSGVFVRFNRNDVVSVTLKGRHDEVLAGQFALGLDGSLNPYVDGILRGSRSVTVNAPNGGTFEPGQNYYLITLPDVQLEEGYSLTVTRSDGMVATFNSLTNIHDLPMNGCRSFTNPLDTYIENEANIASGRSTGWKSGNKITYTTSFPDTLRFYSQKWGSNVRLISNQLISEDPANGRYTYEMVFEKPITEIPYEAFYDRENGVYNTSLVEVILPETLTKIGGCAFMHCENLESVTFGNSLRTIEGGAFYDCPLTSLTLPESLTELDGDAFFSGDNYSTYTSVNIPASLTSLSQNPFSGCPNLAAFTGDSPLISADGRCLVDSDGTMYSFAGGGLTEYTVPAGVKKIESYTFCDVGLESVTFPEGLQTFETYTICYSHDLESITIPSSVTTMYATTFLAVNSLKKITMKGSTPPEIKSRFSSSYNIVDSEKLQDPDLVIEIPGAGAGRYTYNTGTNKWYDLRSHYMVYQADSEIWIHDQNNSLDSYYFVGDLSGNGEYNEISENGLTSNAGNVVMPLSPKQAIPQSILDQYGDNLRIKVYSLPDGQPIVRMPDYGLSDQYPGTSGGSQAERVDWASLPKTVTEIGQKAFMGCSNLLIVPFCEDHMVSIGNDAFNGCSSMKLYEYDSPIPSNGLFYTFFDLESIGERAFMNCTSLNWPMMCHHLMTIGESAFEGSSLYGFIFNGVTDLGKSAFKNCTNLHIYDTGCVIGGSMTEIKESTFEGCSTLKKLRIAGGSPITSIGQNAFKGCTSLETLGYAGSDSYVEGVAQLPTVERLTSSQTFYHTNIKVLKFPDLKYINGTIEFSYSPINQLELPSLEYASSNAFLYMPDLEELYLPSIKTLGTDMFTPGVLLKLHLGPNISSLNNRLWGYGSSPTTFEVELYLDRVTPPSVSEDTFDCRKSGGGNQILAVRAVYVPSGSVNAYRQSTAWATALAVAGATTDVIQAMPTN